ncbi:hypothetical protein NPIL_543971, partial [Nephila pilipes]
MLAAPLWPYRSRFCGKN